MSLCIFSKSIHLLIRNVWSDDRGGVIYLIVWALLILQHCMNKVK